MLRVVPVRPPALKIKKLPEEETPVPHLKDNTTASVFMSQRKREMIFGPFGLTPGDFTD